MELNALAFKSLSSQAQSVASAGMWLQPLESFVLFRLRRALLFQGPTGVFQNLLANAGNCRSAGAFRKVERRYQRRAFL